MKPCMILILTLISIFSFGQEKKYIFVFLHKKSDAAQVPKAVLDSIFKGHMDNMKRLANESKLLAAGPFHGGGGIFVLNTANTQEAQTWLSTDPGIQAKRWDVEMLPYQPRYGGICPVSEPYEMVNYSFVRFTPLVSKFTASTYPQIMTKHHEYLTRIRASGNVVTEAIFGENDGGILIMKGDVSVELFENDPGVQEGLLELNVKKLYIAKGSFCEK